MSIASDSTTYEQPLTERVRSFLRIEYLCAQYRHHESHHNEMGTRARMQSLLDILAVMSRSDLKNEVLKELTEQHAALTRLSKLPDVDTGRLQAILGELAGAINDVQHLGTQFAAMLLRGNDFLLTLNNRSGIPGGTCGFDLPAYQHWLSQPHDTIQRNLQAWYADIYPFEKAIALYLRLLRNSVEPQALVANGGIYVDVPQPACVMLRVTVATDSGVYPEISAGKHRFTVRFMQMREAGSRPHQASGDIAFAMQFCAL